MKKLFSLLTLALLTMSAWAQTTVTFTAGTDLGSTTANGSADTVTKDGVTISCTDAAFATAQYRFYSGSTTTITSTDGNITKVEFTCSGNNTSDNGPGHFSIPTGGTGDYSYNGKVGTWVGNAAEFTLSAAKQVRATQIVVTIGGEAVETVAAPTLPATQFFDDEFEVEITNIAEGATAMYSTDGLAWQTYAAPFTITETTTVYAKAVKGEIESNVVSAKYTKNTPVTGTCITFNYADDTSFTTAKEYTVERVGASFTVSNGLIDGHYRIYKDQTIAFTSTAGNIIRIEFDCTANAGAEKYGPDHLTVNDNNGDYNYAGKLGIWTGSAENVTFTASTAQVRATEIRVYVDGELPTDFVAAPTIPASKNFDNSITVEITNNAEGATLMYNTDGATWQNYTGALTFTETTTLQAKAVKGEKESTVVEATYTKNEPAPGITTLAQVNALDDNTEFTFAGENDVVVTYQVLVNGQNYTFLHDATGYGLLYQDKDHAAAMPELTNGQVLNSGWSATKTTYKGLTEYKNATNVSASENTNAELAAPVDFTEMSDENLNAYVTVKDIKKFTVNGKNITVTLNDDTSIVGYNQFGISDIPTTEGNYTATGIIGKYNNFQLWIIEITGQGAPEPEAVNVNNFNEAYALDNGTKVTMYNDAVVTYQNGSRLFVRDSEGTSGMIYGTLNNTFENGQVLSDAWTATYKMFNDNTPEFEIIDATEISASGETRDASPFKRESIDSTNVNEYVILKGVTLQADTTDTDIFYTAEGLQICNFFNGVEIPAVEEGKNYDVTGIVMISKAGLVRVYITELTEAAAAGLRGDVNNDGDVNIGDVTTLIDYLLNSATEINAANADCTLEGDINIGDVTALIDYLLSNTWPE